MRRTIHLFTAMLFVVSTASVAHALPVIIPDFSVDPSGLQINVQQFTIQAVSAGDPGSNNIVDPPSLEFGVTSIPDGTEDTLKMNWEPKVPGEEAQAGSFVAARLGPASLQRLNQESTGT